MHVDVDIVERQDQIDDENRIASLHQRAAVRLRRRSLDSLVGDGTPVDDDRLQAPVVSREFPRAGIAVDAVAVFARLVKPDQLVGDFGRIDSVDGVFEPSGRAENSLAVDCICDGNVGIGEYQRSDFFGDGFLFLRRLFEKTRAHGRVEEQIGHGDRGSFRRSALFDGGDHASVGRDLRSARLTLRAADDLRLRDGGDRRERLASETERRYVVKIGSSREF